MNKIANLFIFLFFINVFSYEIWESKYNTKNRSTTTYYEGIDYDSTLQTLCIDTIFQHEILQEEGKTISNQTRFVQRVDKKPKRNKRHYDNSNAKYHISESGKNLIKQFEDCKLEAYEDGNGYSIGYGHHTTDVYKGQIITQEEAEQLFKEDIEMVTFSVNRLLSNINYDFSQEFIDGFFSLVYNCGEGSIKGTNFYNTLTTKCRWHTNNDELIKSDLLYTLNFVKTTKLKQGKLIRRRNEEYELMKTNIMVES